MITKQRVVNHYIGSTFYNCVVLLNLINYFRNQIKIIFRFVIHKNYLIEKLNHDYLHNKKNLINILQFFEYYFGRKGIAVKVSCGLLNAG